MAVATTALKTGTALLQVTYLSHVLAIDTVGVRGLERRKIYSSGIVPETPRGAHVSDEERDTCPVALGIAWTRYHEAILVSLVYS
jgi:hypothetical protein